jgi:trans-2,3-dihydro-3-hydroxyanthranilate isomerase
VETLPYTLVDVFAESAFQGNPPAVFVDTPRLDTTIMQAIANELNLSETVFVVASGRTDCLAGLRIFTPKTEMAYAGHPVIGAAAVLIERGRVVSSGAREFGLETRVGRIPVGAEGTAPPLIWLTTPALEWMKVLDDDVCASALGLEPADLLATPPQRVSAGNPTILVALKNPEAVDRARLDAAGMARLRGSDAPACVLVCSRRHSRAPIPACSLPITGSLKIRRLEAPRALWAPV